MVGEELHVCQRVLFLTALEKDIRRYNFISMFPKTSTFLISICLTSDTDSGFWMYRAGERGQ